MKKSLLLIVAICNFVWSADAQITITTSDVAAVGKVIRQAHDTVPTVSVGSAGASQTWNMAALNTHSTDTINFVLPANTPHGSSFPTANIAGEFLGMDAFAYLVNNSSSLTMVGMGITADFGGGPTTIVQKNTPAEILVNFPSTFGTTFNNNFVTEGTFYFGQFGMDSLRQKTDISKIVNADAWGSITTPLGTFPSLRFYEVRNQTDSTFGYNSFTGWSFIQASEDSSKSFSWWANGVGFPLVDVQTNWAVDTVMGVDWLLALPAVGINEQNTTSQVMVYPNPAQDEVNFALESPQGKSINIYDVTGRLVEVYLVEDAVTKINTSKYSAGSYSYQIVEKNSNKVFNRGKLIVVK